MPLNYDMYNVTHENDATNFSAMLLRLIFKADLANRLKLRQSFPSAVKMVDEYQKTGEILDLEYD